MTYITYIIYFFNKKPETTLATSISNRQLTTNFQQKKIILITRCDNLTYLISLNFVTPKRLFLLNEFAIKQTNCLKKRRLEKKN